MEISEITGVGIRLLLAFAGAVAGIRIVDDIRAAAARVRAQREVK